MLANSRPLFVKPARFRLFFFFVLCLVHATFCFADLTLDADITRLGVGARPLGMGKMFTGLADDISSIYLNPAGTGTVKNPEFLSMSGKFVNAVNYLTFAGLLPTAYGTLGLGYAGADLSFGTPVLNLVEIAPGEYRVIPSTTESISYQYTNYAVSLTYGVNLFRPDLYFGSGLKLFNEKISGLGGGSAFGYDLDLGLLMKPNDSLTLGLMGKNLLPVSLGGKIKWDTGLEEALPASLNAGASIKFKMLGEMILGSDYEFKPRQSNIPGLFHSGLEWRPTGILSLRAGIDQDLIGRESGTAFDITNNPTGGISLKIDDFRFDYGYHRYNDISANDTNYFSIVYQPSSRPTIAPSLEIFAPADKFVTDEAAITLTGRAAGSNVKTVTVNGKTIAINASGSFEALLPLSVGKNIFWVSSFNRTGKLIGRQRLRGIRLTAFPDLPADFWAKNEIERLATIGVIKGFKDGNFHPNETIKRVDLLVQLLKIDETPTLEAAVLPFKDVSPGAWFAPYLNTGFENRIVLGYPDSTFRPGRAANRVEGITMTVRTSLYTLSEVLEHPYLDVTARHWAIKEVTTAKENQLLTFVLQNLYPKQNLTRAEFAAIIAHTPKIRTRIDALLNLETGED